jgi:hypothetical protein
MGKGKALRLGGFAVALTASAALVASATGATGAYFTDSHSGSVTATSGHLTLNVTDPNLNFAGLVPGVDKTLNVDYNTDSSVNEDIWLVFSATDPGYQAWTGPKSNAFGGGLGRFGHFAVANNNSVDFQSYNLQLLDPAVPNPVCPVDANGDGGSSQQSSSVSDTPPLCGVPQAILLAQNVASGVNGQIEMTFGLTGRAKGQNASVASVPFTIVATQHGISPDAPNS